jgi:hypothetical protein
MGTWNGTKWPKMGRAGPISEYLTDPKMVVLCIHELFSTCYRQALGSSLFQRSGLTTARRPIVEMPVSWVEMGGVWGGERWCLGAFGMALLQR